MIAIVDFCQNIPSLIAFKMTSSVSLPSGVVDTHISKSKDRMFQMLRKSNERTHLELVEQKLAQSGAEFILFILQKANSAISVAYSSQLVKLAKPSVPAMSFSNTEATVAAAGGSSPGQ